MAQRKGRGVPICSVVIPAAGSSSRMEGIDKILEPLGELPVLVRTLQVFQSCDLVHEVIVVTREDLIVPVSQLCRDFMLDKVTKVMVGGAERVLSVRIGVQEARRDAALIAIHDGARPLLSREVLEEVLKKAAVTGAFGSYTGAAGVGGRGGGGGGGAGAGYRGGGAGHSHGGYHQAGRAGRCGGDDGPLQPVGGPDAPGL